MSTPADARRRWFGLLFLVLAGALLVWGQTWLRPHLKGMTFCFYWLACFIFTGLALLTALLDLMAIRRREREQQRKLVQDTLDAIESNGEAPPQAPPPAPQDK